MTHIFNTLESIVKDSSENAYTLEVRKYKDNYHMRTKHSKHGIIYLPNNKGVNHFLRKYPLFDSAMNSFQLNLEKVGKSYVGEMFLLNVSIRGLLGKDLYKVVVSENFETIFETYENALQEQLSLLETPIIRHATHQEYLNILIQNFYIHASFFDRNNFWVEECIIKEEITKIFSNIFEERNLEFQIEYNQETKEFIVVEGSKRFINTSLSEVMLALELERKERKKVTEESNMELSRKRKE